VPDLATRPRPRKYQNSLVIAATLAIAAALVVTGNLLTNSEPPTSDPAAVAPQAEEFNDPGEAHIASRYPDRITASVVDLTQSTTPWGTSFTLEMPHPLRSDLTVVFRTWSRVPHPLPWEKNQEVTFTKDQSGGTSYTLAGDLEIWLRWDEMEIDTRGDGESDHPCARATVDAPPGRQDTRARDGCVAPVLEGLSVADFTPNEFSSWAAWANGAGGAPGLALTSWSAFGDENMTFTLLAVVDNPDPAREALSDPELTTKGTWASRPAALFAFDAPGGGDDGE